MTQVARGAVGNRPNVKAVNAERKGFFGYSLCTVKWRYTEWDEGKVGREIYDHDQDPREITNLADDPAFAKTVAELSAQIQLAVKSTFPLSGETPMIQEGLWAPLLIDP